MSTEKMILKARALAKKGAVAEARLIYETVLKKFPSNKRALEGMQALADTPAPPEPTALLQEMIAYYNNGRMAELLRASDRAITVYPTHLTVLQLRAAAQMALGQAQAAIATYDRIVTLEPGNADAFGNRGNAQSAAGHSEAALQSFHKVLELRPGDPTALNNIGNIQIEQGKPAEAQASFEAALHSAPDYTPALVNLGNVLKIRGETGRAAEILSRAVAQGDAGGEAYWNLASVKSFAPDAPEIAQMEAALGRNRLTERDKMLIGFALGKAYDDTGDVTRAFHHLTAANRIQKGLLGYKLEDDLNRLAALKSVFGAGSLPVATIPQDAPRPIFIVGMPRSGTSLLEQMLSAHSDIHGGGEIALLDNALSRLDWTDSAAFLAAAPRLQADYLAHLQTLGQGAACVTDKLPLNFEWIGAILSIFPQAKIVHVSRDARATCWSNFKHYYSSNGNGFAYDLSDTVAYYGAYRDLMRHWDRLFGARLFHLDYDRMTQAAEPVLRDLLAYLGLDWQAACLAPEQNRRAVYTSSATQVRRGIYQDSSQAWERYAELIGPAFDPLPR
ncbi:tetratricopeptide repeat-containing sulfotransferase family protein [Roseibaca sp. Y0-43]|uniref:tetratricopeptide repeat-containing sulfotransferase family protein n=1 Tax=Roseibaca sp. Y0-43 TaxID=2816854 RepID=UPI001D0C5C21|nr:tetratricopeptide repeat-containing sulfotransferase family protein [Roseibaca sp. Y0-43]MCC1480014.1 sulfotransferase [Roseibaca sp. Y0-43]